MRSRRALIKKLLGTAGFLSAAFIAYLYLGLFPGDLNPAVVRQIERLTQKNVTFEKALWLPFRGLVFENLAVKNARNELLFSSNRLSVDVDLITFFKEKKIIVRHVTLDSPRYDYFPEEPRVKSTAPPLKTKLSGQITLPVIPEKNSLAQESLEEGPDALLPENVYLKSVRIHNGTLVIRQKKSGPPVEILQSIELRLAFENPPNLTLDGSFGVGANRYAQVALQGTWNLDDPRYEFRLETSSRLIPGWLRDYQKNYLLKVEKVAVKLKTHLKSVGQGRALFRADAGLRDAVIRSKESVFTGQLGLALEGVFNFDTKIFESYRGLIKFGPLDALNLSKEIPRLEGLAGKVFLEPDRVRFQGVRGQFKKIPFEADGVIRSFKDLRLDMLVRVRTSLEQVMALVPPEHKGFLSRFKLTGICESATLLEGPLKNPSALRPSHKLLVRNGTLQSMDKKITLTNLFTEVLVKDPWVKIARCRFVLAGKTYTLQALIPQAGSKKPGDFKLSSKDWFFSSAWSLKDKNFYLTDARLMAAGVEATLGGKISNEDSPRMNLSGNFSLDTAKAVPFVQSLLPSPKDRASSFRPADAGLAGPVRGVFQVEGPLNTPLNWDLKIDGQGQSLRIKNKLKLDSANFQVRMKNRILNIPYWQARGYRGMLGGKIKFHLGRAHAPFDAFVYANQLNLGSLIRDLGAKGENLSGTLIFNTTLQGFFKSPSTWRGAGAVDLRDGALWKTDQFKQMGELPFVRVLGLDEVMFRNLSSQFVIRDKKITSDNLHLSGDTVKLSLKGSVGFDQSLDLVMNIQYSDDVIRGAHVTGGLAPFVVEQAERMISQYEVSGTVQKPKFEKSLRPAR